MKTKKVSISLFQIILILLIIIAIIVAIIVMKNKGIGIGNLSFEPETYAGSGTSEDPYKIEKIEDLVSLAKNVNSGKTYKDKYFILVDKLDFREDESYRNMDDQTFGDINNDGQVDNIKNELTQGLGFEPIGGKETKGNNITSFEGIFDGNDKTIKNFTLNISNDVSYSYIGLFGSNKGTITNLRIMGNIFVDENLDNKNLCIGMIAAKNEGIMKSCVTEGTIVSTINGSANYAKVGGIAGENTGTITDSVNNINITSNQLKAGIVAQNSIVEGQQESGKIDNCTNNGEIKELSSTSSYTAGIVAENKSGSIVNCTNDGNAEGKLVGGIVGNAKGGSIIACQNTGAITNIKENSTDTEIVGGIVALLEENATLENCKNTGSILGLTNIGGIAGENRANISQATNEGNISKINEIIANKVNIGGITGLNYSGKIANSKNYGTISSEVDSLVKLGGICGSLYSNSLIDTCENNGTLLGEGKIIIPNEDLTINCSNCTNNAGGSAQRTAEGELYLGLIYGKFEEDIDTSSIDNDLPSNIENNIENDTINDIDNIINDNNIVTNEGTINNINE